MYTLLKRGALKHHEHTVNPLVLQEIYRRAIVAEQVLNSGNQIDEATLLQLFESIRLDMFA